MFYLLIFIQLRSYQGLMFSCYFLKLSSAHLSFVLLCHGAGPFKRGNSKRMVIGLPENLMIDSLRKVTTICWVPAVTRAYSACDLQNYLRKNMLLSPFYKEENEGPEKLSTQCKRKTMWSQTLYYHNHMRVVAFMGEACMNWRGPILWNLTCLYFSRELFSLCKVSIYYHQFP